MAINDDSEMHERIIVRSRRGDMVLIAGKWALCTVCLLAVLGIVALVLGVT